MNLQHRHYKIKLLPEFLIDQIKAGEIIERPANLLKEVIENSIDAQSDKIEIHIVENGLRQITVQDNGVGIPFADLPYAFCRHTTSKIEKFQDLYSLDSFGFRGEALASIASIAQVTCISRCRDDENIEGGQVSIVGGQAQEPIKQADLPYGTLLIIKDLFFNTPVRLNFIKSQTAEKNSLLHTLRAFFISHPQVEFHLKWDREEKNILRPGSRFQRFTQALSNNRWAKDDFNFVEQQYQDYSLTGFYSKVAKRSGQTKNQYLFINKRLVQDKVLHRIICSALEDCWPPGNSGPYVVELEVPADQMDVNVHPNKTMVKFASPSLVHSLLHSGIKKGLAPQALPVEESRASEDGRENENGHGMKVENRENDEQGKHETREESDGKNDLKKERFQSYEQRYQSSPQSTISIGHRYRILPRENDFPLVVDCAALMRLHLASIKSQFPSKDRVPLMVGIPFRGREIVSQILRYEHWERDQFEFDILTNDLAVLRSIPHDLIPLPQRATLYYLIGEEGAFEREMAAESLSTKTLQNLLGRYPQAQLVRAQSIATLDIQSITRLFP